MAVAALVVIGVGVLCVLAGLFVTLVEWHDKRKPRRRELAGADLGLDKTLNALQKLLVELAKHPIGINLIVLGIVLILIGGGLGGVAGLTG